MENTLPPIGILPNQLWPTPAKDGHAERVFMNEPNLRVLLETFSTTATSPLHIHTHADRFVFLAEGDITFVSAKTCVRLEPSQGLIIRAGVPHGFSVSEKGAKLVYLSAGTGVQESTSRLPDHIRQQFAPLQDTLSRLERFTHETRWKDLYSRFEVETMHWVKQSMITSFKKGGKPPFELAPHKHEGASTPMQGWQTPTAFIVKVKGYSYGFSHHNEGGREYIKVNRVFTLRFAMNRSDKKIPVLK